MSLFDELWGDDDGELADAPEPDWSDVERDQLAALLDDYGEAISDDAKAALLSIYDDDGDYDDSEQDYEVDADVTDPYPED